MIPKGLRIGTKSGAMTAKWPAVPEQRRRQGDQKSMPASEPTSGEAASRTSVIRKYANRRLYDTASARCITLADVARRVRAGEDIRVVTARGGTDVTRQILAQILCEDEAVGRGVLDEDMLARLIRLAHRPVRQRVAAALTRALDRIGEDDPPTRRRAARLRPRGSETARTVAARLDALETRLRSLIADADVRAARTPRR